MSRRPSFSAQGAVSKTDDLPGQSKPLYTEKQVIDMLRGIFVDHDGRVDLKQFPKVRHALDDMFLLSDAFSSQTDQDVFDSIDKVGSGFVSFKNSLPWQLQRLRLKKRLMEKQAHLGDVDDSDALSSLLKGNSRAASKESTGAVKKGASSGKEVLPNGFNSGRRRSEPLLGDHFSQMKPGTSSTAVRAGDGIIKSARDQHRPKKLQVQIAKIEGPSRSVSPHPDRPASRSTSPHLPAERSGSPQCPGPNYKFERGQWRLKTAKQIMSDMDHMETIAKKARDAAKEVEKASFHHKKQSQFKTNDTVATNLSDSDDDN
eukprot:gnl/MRDRNA2_/MRDRNA2_100144_c0_seq1.p1 gnl/MRDRNA2_/MRDRNA2_100144_c0~~gnl/MRDRNA2_/MRDRNA2_100144_c0_seq1.p1  ORF type:complete len:316 (-),score=78.17 gnl/MRDRNA2_/MRDRNA2_100144_c0_seq1:188-1135(-)